MRVDKKICTRQDRLYLPATHSFIVKGSKINLFTFSMEKLMDGNSLIYVFTDFVCFDLCEGERREGKGGKLKGRGGEGREGKRRGEMEGEEEEEGRGGKRRR